MIPWQKLKTFCTAARHQSFKHAADELCLSPSAVSHQLRDLEAQLGVELFERKTRKVILTLAGQTLYQQIDPKLRAVEDAVAQLRVEPGSHTVHIKMPEFFASELFAPRVAEFSARNRQIQLRIETSQSDMSSAAAADVAIVLAGEQPKFPEVHRLFPIRFVPACSQKACDDLTEPSLDVLNRSTLLVHEARPEGWQQWAEAAGLGALDPHQIIRFDSMRALLKATGQGIGIGLLPMPLSRAAFDSGMVRRLSATDYETTDFYSLVAARNPNAATQTLIRWVRETFTNHS